MAKPVVALVGRPNVGKSTLFNRLAEERLAVVDDVPGTTRDRIVAEAEWAGVSFDLVDTGGIDPSQTGPGRSKEPLSVGSADFINEIRQQAEIAIREADTVLFITDAESGVTPADQEVAQILRRMQHDENGTPTPPVILAVNKSDSEARRMQALQFYELGLGEPYPISALHGTGTGDMLDALVATFAQHGEEEEDESVKIAIVGKPNVGKSSLLNRLLGEERAIVSPIPGTTRDAIDTHLEYGDIPLTLIDTAGIRKRGKIEPGVEKYSVMRSLKAIERADVTLLVIDATSGITAQDTHIAGFILDAWKSAVVVVNKWDAISKDTYTMDAFTQHVRRELNFMDYVPVLFISAKTGQRVDQVLAMALRVQEERLVRLSTSQVNQILEKAQEAHPAPSHAGRQLRIYYGTQVRSDPPTFLLYSNDPKLAHFSYERYLENQFRSAYNFLGTPIRLVFRARR
ncbi:MAG: ribosome biogenesis GTPase Der [Omnitrophica WOR_2 bacterium]